MVGILLVLLKMLAIPTVLDTAKYLELKANVRITKWTAMGVEVKADEKENGAKPKKTKVVLSARVAKIEKIPCATCCPVSDRFENVYFFMNTPANKIAQIPDIPIASGRR